MNTRECIQELRRGSEQATIYSIAFDLSSQYLSCSSDSGTVHIFALKQLKEEEETLNRRSKFAILSKISSYFDSQWSFASYHTSEKKTKVGFLAKENKVVIVSTSVLIQLCRVWFTLLPFRLKNSKTIAAPRSQSTTCLNWTTSLDIARVIKII